MSLFGSRRRLGALAVIACLVATLSGCGSGRGDGSSATSQGEVAVTVGDQTVPLPPALACFQPTKGSDISCAGGEDDDAAPHLVIPPGEPVQIDVAASVQEKPWVVVISYIDGDGQQQGDRTGIFPPDTASSYLLQLGDADQLQRIEVQTLTAAPTQDGSYEFPATGTWVLVVDAPTDDT